MVVTKIVYYNFRITTNLFFVSTQIQHCFNVVKITPIQHWYHVMSTDVETFFQHMLRSKQRWLFAGELNLLILKVSQVFLFQLTHLIPMHPFSTTLKASENRNWWFQGIEEGSIGNRLVKSILLLRDIIFLLYSYLLHYYSPQWALYICSYLLELFR